jgi:hypothetical protein
MTAAAIAPSKTRSVEPTAIGQAANPHAVRSTTSLTNASSALEPDPLADLSPISWIELSHFRSDWHQYPTAATPVPAVVATYASDAKSARKSWRHQHSLSSLESRGPEAAESSVQQHETPPLRRQVGVRRWRFWHNPRPQPGKSAAHPVEHAPQGGSAMRFPDHLIELLEDDPGRRQGPMLLARRCSLAKPPPGGGWKGRQDHQSETRRLPPVVAPHACSSLPPEWAFGSVTLSRPG